MITPLLMSLQATNLAYTSANKMFGANQSLLGLANSVTGQESPRDLAQLQQMEKALTFQGIMAKTNLEAAWAMQEAAAKMQERERKMKERLMDAGAIFV
jgi:hypothetical protein